MGGGIYGAACAWDAAQRGLRVALVERDDYGAGTSWNSLKTIHGGLRYLQRLDLVRMRASIEERATLLRIAPALVRPLPFVVPAYGHGRAGREALGVALALTELVGLGRNRGLAASRRIPRARLLSRLDLGRIAPGLPQAGLRGGALWWDAQVSSSERLLLAFLHAAASAGAVLVNYSEVIGFARAPDGSVAGARVRDREAGDEIELRAAMVLNCGGPGMGAVAGFAVQPPPAVPLVRAYNLVLGRAAVSEHALGVRHRGRFLFAVPWNGVSILGTAYEPAADGPGPAAFLEECRAAFAWMDLRAEDVRCVHSGLVPGEDATHLASRPLLLDHARDGAPGLVSLLGVKYTTARRVAERAVDLVLRRLGRPAAACRTAETPLPLPPPHASLEAAVRFAALEEQAVHLSDVVLRRADLGTAGRPPADLVERAEQAMAAALGWNHPRRAAERQALERDLGRLELPGNAVPRAQSPTLQ